jgi:hypothetical protein
MEISACPGDYTAQSAQGAGWIKTRARQNPVGSPASRRGTGASIAHERVLSQVALPLAPPLRSQGLPLSHGDDQPEDVQRTAGSARLTRDQLGLALPVACV